MRIAALGFSLALLSFARCSDNSSAAGDVDAKVDGTSPNNVAPSVTITAPGEAQVFEAGALVTLSGRGVDDKDSPGALTFHWTSDLQGSLGPAGTSASEWSALEVHLTTAGLQTITLEVTDSDGAVGKASVHVTVNGPPTAPGVSITPAAPTTDDALVANIDTPAVDPNGHTLTYSYHWFRNGADSGLAAPRVDPTATTAGELWQVRVTASDGTLFGPQGIAEVTIGNAPPTCDAAVLLPNAGDTTTTFSCRCQGRHDLDPTDTAHDTCVFYDADRTITTVDAVDGVCLLNPDETTRGDAIHCDYIAADGTQTAAPKTSATIVVNDAPPPAVEVTLDPTTATASTELACRVVAPVVDVDGDPVSYLAAWVVNGFENPEGNALTVVASDLSRNAANEHARRGDEVHCRVRAFDGMAGSRPSDSNHVTLSNAPPSGGSVVVQLPLGKDAAREGDSLTCAASGAVDPDGESVQWTYVWYVNDALVAGATDPTLTSDHFNSGDRVACTATPTDGTLAGESRPSKTVATIANSLPSLVRATLAPAETNRLGTFTCGFEGWADPDPAHATPQVEYAWLTGTRGTGTVIAGQSAATLLATGMVPGTMVYCRVTPLNGLIAGVPVESANGTVINHKPIVTQAKLSPTVAFADSALTCEAIGATDEDGDSVTVRYGWQIGGQPIASAQEATLVTGFKKGDQIRCSVTPNDGWTDGPATLSNPVVIGNKLPTITGVTLAPSFGTPCDTYTCSADRIVDPDPDDTVLSSYRWVLNGDPLPDATSTLVGDGRITPDDILQCFVKATDGSLDANLDPLSGPEAASNEADVYNSPPRVAAVAIEPSVPLIGAKLTCVPSGFTDDECNPTPAYAYRWYKGADPILGATTSTLTTTSMPVGASVACQAIPFDGYDYGAPKLSGSVTLGNHAPTAPVVALDAPNGANGVVTCKLVTPATDDEALTYTWRWQLGTAPAFTTPGQTLAADAVHDCDRVRCWADVTDTHVSVTSNIADTILPFGSDCDDQNVCTDDACGATGGCAPTYNTKPCSDRDACNGAETCQGGICQNGPPVDCAGVTNPCLQKTCNPSTGGCDLPKADNTSCADADLCDGPETCHSGVCQPGSAVDCSGVTNPCLQKTCNAATGLCNLPKPDETSCADASLCNGAETCHSGTCQSGIQVDCSGVTNPCLQKSCNATTGACDLLMPDDTQCPDGNPCNGAESCKSGVCQAGTPTDCSSVTYPCLEKTCNPSTGACDLPKPNNTPCGPDDACATAKTCQAGICTGGTSIDCSGVTDSCLQQACNPATGSCDLPVADGVFCTAADACTADDICQAGMCSTGTPVAGTPECGCVLPSDLMLYYDFEGEIADQSGNDRDATAPVVPTYALGHQGQAIAFDGTYKLTVGNGRALAPTTSRARTVSFWMDTGPTGTGSVIGQYASSPATDTFEVTYTRSPTGRFEASGTGVNIVQYPAGSTLSGWHHWAIAFAAGANGVRIYKDGVLVAQGALTLNAAESALAVTVGGLAATGTPLTARIDELRVYARALTTSEIAQLAGICSPAQPAACGNGVLDPGETCDDGNTVDDDNCSNACVPAWPCPSGVMPDGTRFMVCANKTSWANARLECQALGFDDLASVRSASENALLASLSQDAGPDVDLFWIGLTDAVSEGQHVWSDGAPKTFTNWDPGEPNNLYLGCPGNEDCVHFYRAGPRMGHWNDAICCSNGVGYACERRP